MQTSHMPRLVHSGSGVYRVLLFFYPGSLRSRFAPEMLAVFEDQVRSGWEQSGYRGVFLNWWLALKELLSIALLARLDALKIPVVSILLSLLLALVFFAKVVPPCPK